MTATTVVTTEVPAGGGGVWGGLNVRAIAGGAVGEVAFGAILMFLGVLLAWYFRKRRVDGVQGGSPHAPMGPPYGQTPELGRRQ